MGTQELTYKQAFQDRDPHPTVMIVDDNEADRTRFKLVLEKSAKENQQLNILCASSIDEAEQILSRTPVHVVMLDKNLGENENDPRQNGIKSIPSLLLIQPHLEILVITGSGNFDDVREATKFGASDFIGKDIPNDLLIARINRTIKHAKAAIQNRQHEFSSQSSPIELGGKSKVFQQILAHARILSETERPILLLGESGTGKTELASWINQCREKFLGQTNRPFFSFNIAALATDVVENELFGHEKGAFTDAHQMKQGFFEVANNGTLFIDEIGEASLELQAKLLTVIETGEFYRIGGKKKMTSSAKLIFATNRDLEAMVEAKTFRQDLYMRINSFPIQMPSLRDRSEDIPDIIKALVPKVSKKNNVPVKFEDIPKDFIEHLLNSEIEGNVRGIIAQLDRLLVFAPKDENRRPMLEKWRTISGLYAKPKKNTRSTPDTGPITMDEIKKRSFDVLDPSFPGIKEFTAILKAKVVQEACDKHNGELKKVASVLKVATSYIYPLVKRSGPDNKIEVPTFVEVAQELGGLQ